MTGALALWLAPGVASFALSLGYWLGARRGGRAWMAGFWRGGEAGIRLTMDSFEESLRVGGRAVPPGVRFKAAAQAEQSTRSARKSVAS